MRSQTMTPFEEYVRYETRRQFLSRGKNALGMAAMASLMGPSFARGAGAAEGGKPAGIMPRQIGLPSLPHFAPRAKQVIYLHMVGGPSQIDLYDYKPQMNEFYDKDLPD